MIFTAFDMKFDEKKDEIPPGACRHPKQWGWRGVRRGEGERVRGWEKGGKYKKNNVQEVRSPLVRTSGGSGGRSPPGRKKREV